MYREAGYGENWQPRTNNARRIDPYSRSCAILSCFFTIGFVLIIIIVLSLIPVYISHNSSTKNTGIQVSQVHINGYTLQFYSPSDNFDSKTILSNSNNLQALQASFTSMIQNDSILAGSVIEISTLPTSSKRKRRQISRLIDITFNLYVTSNSSCISSICSNRFHEHVTRQLSDKNRTTSVIRYEQVNTNETIQSLSSQIYWLQYQLPNSIRSSVSIVNIDLNKLTLLLETLINLNKHLNQPSISNLITSTPNIIA